MGGEKDEGWCSERDAVDGRAWSREGWRDCHHRRGSLFNRNDEEGGSRSYEVGEGNPEGEGTEAGKAKGSLGELGQVVHAGGHLQIRFRGVIATFQTNKQKRKHTFAPS